MTPRPAPLHQPARGYRYAVDSLLLVDFAAQPAARACLDLGTGSGVIALRLLERGGCALAVGIERQAELATCARDNARDLGLAARFRVVEADLRTVRGEPPETFDLVVANPPFHPARTGRPSPLPGRAAARHELDTTLADFVAAAARALAPQGRFCVVLPASRIDEHRALLEAAGLSPRRVRFVHATPSRPAHLVLCEAIPGSATLATDPPLFLGG